MLEDNVRNKAYLQAIEANKAAFSGSTVLDVGAGSGLLSVMCARAGATRVYAVEASGLYTLAEEIAAENNFKNVIQVSDSADFSIIKYKFNLYFLYG